MPRVRICCWGLDSGLHVQHTTKHITQVTIESLDILIGIRNSKVILIGMRIDKTGAELHELDVHGVVHAGRVTLEIRTGTLKGSLLLIVVKTDIIGIVDTATTEVHTVVLTNARLEGFTEPIGVGIVHKMVFPVCTQTVTTGNRNTGILGGNAKILTVLLGICQVVDILLNLVYTEVTFIINLQRLFFLTVLG